MGAFKGKYSSITDAHCLDVNRLVSQIKQALLKRSPKLNPDETRVEVGTNLNVFRVDGQSFEFTSIPNKLGGLRWMVLCPKCKKRVIRLYLPEEEGKEKKYYCKECHELRPPSALYGPTRRYKEMVRPLRQMEKIKQTLSSKKMSETKTKALLDKYELLESQVKGSTFYRKMCLLSTPINPNA